MAGLPAVLRMASIISVPFQLRLGVWLAMYENLCPGAALPCRLRRPAVGLASHVD
jgi:hypothetical protein